MSHEDPALNAMDPDVIAIPGSRPSELVSRQRPTRAGRFARCGPPLLGTLVAATSLALAVYASVWLVPAYLLLITWIVGLPASLRRRARRAAARAIEVVGTRSVGSRKARTSSVQTDANGRFRLDDPVDSDFPTDLEDNSESDEEVEDGSEGIGFSSSTLGELVGAKPRRSRGRGRKGKAAPPVESPAVTWVQVGPGKFVRSDTPDSPVGEHTAPETPTDPDSVPEQGEAEGPFPSLIEQPEVRDHQLDDQQADDGLPAPDVGEASILEVGQSPIVGVVDEASQDARGFAEDEVEVAEGRDESFKTEAQEDGAASGSGDLVDIEIMGEDNGIAPEASPLEALDDWNEPTAEEPAVPEESEELDVPEILPDAFIESEPIPEESMASLDLTDSDLIEEVQPREDEFRASGEAAVDPSRSSGWFEEAPPVTALALERAEGCVDRFHFADPGRRSRVRRATRLGRSSSVVATMRGTGRWGGVGSRVRSAFQPSPPTRRCPRHARRFHSIHRNQPPRSPPARQRIASRGIAAGAAVGPIGLAAAPVLFG